MNTLKYIGWSTLIGSVFFVLGFQFASRRDVFYVLNSKYKCMIDVQNDGVFVLDSKNSSRMLVNNDTVGFSVGGIDVCASKTNGEVTRLYLSKRSPSGTIHAYDNNSDMLIDRIDMGNAENLKQYKFIYELDGLGGITAIRKESVHEVK